MYLKFIILVVVVLLAAISWVAVKSGHSNRHYIEAAISDDLASVQRDLKDAEVVNGATNSLVTSVEIERVLLKKDGSLKYFPSFISKSNVFIVSGETSMNSSNALIAIQVDGQTFISVDGRGQIKKLTLDAIEHGDYHCLR
jgi:hypothetical protein